jgi:hypothetical protein
MILVLSKSHRELCAGLQMILTVSAATQRTCLASGSQMYTRLVESHHHMAPGWPARTNACLDDQRLTLGSFDHLFMSPEF